MRTKQKMKNKIFTKMLKATFRKKYNKLNKDQKLHE